MSGWQTDSQQEELVQEVDATLGITIPSAHLTRGLRLCGQALEPPYLVKTGWQSGQVFSETQDPDRMQQPWHAPDFVQHKDPLSQRTKTTVDDLPIGGVNGARPSSFAKVVHRVLDEEDCAALLACVNKKGFTPALLNIGRGNQMLIPEARDGHRVIVDSSPLTNWLFEVLRPHIPEEFSGAALVDLNERCRFLCYTPGQSFASHFD